MPDVIAKTKYGTKVRLLHQLLHGDTKEVFGYMVEGPNGAHIPVSIDDLVINAEYTGDQPVNNGNITEDPSADEVQSGMGASKVIHRQPHVEEADDGTDGSSVAEPVITEATAEELKAAMMAPPEERPVEQVVEQQEKVEETTPVAPVAPVVAEAPKRRGRPPGAKNKPKDAAPVIPAGPSAVPAMPALPEKDKAPRVSQEYIAPEVSNDDPIPGRKTRKPRTVKAKAEAPKRRGRPPKAAAEPKKRPGRPPKATKAPKAAKVAKKAPGRRGRPPGSKNKPKG